MGVATGFWYQRNADYLLFDVLTGVAGSILGLFLDFIAHTGQVFGLFSWMGIVADIVGAAVFIGLYQLVLAIPKRKHKNIKGGEE
jgi:uncharacterized membrane protein YeaQ/YmgE (transglycosylase-associated protein family)